jgi:hypothetical protein
MAESLAKTLPLFLSPDNAVRNAAEQSFVAARQEPSAFLSALQQLATNLPQPELRQMAAVLFRRNCVKELWDLVDKSIQENIKANLLASICTEPHPNVKKAISEAVSKLACVVCSSGMIVVIPYDQIDSYRLHCTQVLGLSSCQRYSICACLRTKKTWV